MIRSVDDPLGPVGQDPDSARDTACELTASVTTCTPPTIEPPEPPPVDFVAGGGTGPGLGTLLVVLLVVALVAAIVWLVLAAIERRGPLDDEEAVADVDEDLDETSDERIVDDSRPPDRWRRAAAEHRAAGRFRDAVRCQYRALVGDLARAGIVDEIPGRTSGEEREQLRMLAADVAPAFDAAADIFDAAWFDDAEVTVDHDERFLRAERTVLDHVDRRAVAPSRRRTPARSGGR